jgi:hypothetical protein
MVRALKKRGEGEIVKEGRTTALCRQPRPGRQTRESHGRAGGPAGAVRRLAALVIWAGQNANTFGGVVQVIDNDSLETGTACW